MLIKGVTIGADPEMFIIDTAENNKVISSIGMIPGKKGESFVDPKWAEGFGLETDNVLAEFNIPPCTSRVEFVTYIEFMKDYVRGFVKKVKASYDIQCVASRIVDADQLTTPESMEFGCDADYNVYTESVNEKPKCDDANLRSAGFHVHVGYDGFNTNTSLHLVRMLDLFLGIPSILVDPDTKRRSLYGKAGNFRLQPWGVEYRVLSSFMMSSDDLVSKVYNNTMSAINIYNDYGTIDIDPELVKHIINDNDKTKAKQVIKKYNIPVM